MTKQVEVTIHNEYGNISLLLILIGVILYLVFIATRFMPGLTAILDIVGKNYVTNKMTFVSSYIADNGMFYRINKLNYNYNIKTKLNESYFLKLILADNKGKSIYTTTYCHKMEIGKAYMITYGKYSKVVLSVLSSENEEMLQFDVN
ncbi:MAG: hypothetical protein VB118_11930 [Oscillospiraceae bacterium]|nr:hypothetical protein [Oscillospiraceae bacterium]